MRFPQTAALIAQEGTDIIEAIFAHDDFQALLERKMEARIMATVQELKTALDAAKDSFDGLVGKVGQGQGGIDPAELDPILSEINDLKTKIGDVISSLPEKGAAPAPAPTSTGTTDPTVGTSGTAPVNPLN